MRLLSARSALSRNGWFRTHRHRSVGHRTLHHPSWGSAWTVWCIPVCLVAKHAECGKLALVVPDERLLIEIQLVPWSNGVGRRRRSEPPTNGFAVLVLAFALTTLCHDPGCQLSSLAAMTSTRSAIRERNRARSREGYSWTATSFNTAERGSSSPFLARSSKRDAVIRRYSYPEGRTVPSPAVKAAIDFVAVRAVRGAVELPATGPPGC